MSTKCIDELWLPSHHVLKLIYAYVVSLFYLAYFLSYILLKYLTEFIYPFVIFDMNMHLKQISRVIIAALIILVEVQFKELFFNTFCNYSVLRW